MIGRQRDCNSAYCCALHVRYSEQWKLSGLFPPCSACSAGLARSELGRFVHPANPRETAERVTIPVDVLALRKMMGWLNSGDRGWW